MNFEKNNLQTSTDSNKYWGDDHDRQPIKSIPSDTDSDSDSEHSYESDTISMSDQLESSHATRSLRDSGSLNASRSLKHSGSEDINLRDTEYDSEEEDSEEEEDYELPKRKTSSNPFSACCVNVFMMGVGVLIAGLYTKQCYFPNTDLVNFTLN